MKRTLTLLLLACLAALTLPAAAGTLPPDAAAIAAVKAGTRPVAEAAWWGFDSEDATAALQAAIDSGARKVILKDMKTNWVVGRTINLASDQELVLEKGVVLQAKRGAFKSRGDRLLSAVDKKNIAIPARAPRSACGAVTTTARPTPNRNSATPSASAAAAA